MTIKSAKEFAQAAINATDVSVKLDKLAEAIIELTTPIANIHKAVRRPAGDKKVPAKKAPAKKARVARRAARAAKKAGA